MNQDYYRIIDTKTMKNNAFVSTYFTACRLISPITTKVYFTGYNLLGPKFKDFAYISLKFIFKHVSQFKGLQTYTTYRNIQLKLSLEEAFHLGLLYYGVINPYETKILEKILKKGDVVFDIGAYVDGWYTILPARIIGNSGHIYSFEPHPVFFKRLKDNVTMNNLKNVTLVEKGMYDKSQKVSFFASAGCSSVIQEHAESYNGRAEKMTIQTTTIDTFIEKNKLKKVDLIKIDVEGIEMKVLKGGEKMFKKMYPDILLEIVDKQLKLGGSNKETVLSFLKKLGYTGYVFTIEGLKLYKKGMKSDTSNLYFTAKPLPSGI